MSHLRFSAEIRGQFFLGPGLPWITGLAVGTGEHHRTIGHGDPGFVLGSFPKRRGI